MTSQPEKWSWRELNKRYAQECKATKIRREYEKNYKPSNCLEKQLERYKNIKK